MANRDESSILASSAAGSCWKEATRKVNYPRGLSARSVGSGKAAKVVSTPGCPAIAPIALGAMGDRLLNCSTGFANAGIAGSGKAPVVRDACGPASGFSMTMPIDESNRYRPSQYQRFFAVLSKSLIVSAALPARSWQAGSCCSRSARFSRDISLCRQVG